MASYVHALTGSVLISPGIFWKCKRDQSKRPAVTYSACFSGNWKGRNRHNLRSTQCGFFGFLRRIFITLGPTGMCVVVIFFQQR